MIDEAVGRRRCLRARRNARHICAAVVCSLLSSSILKTSLVALMDVLARMTSQEHIGLCHHAAVRRSSSGRIVVSESDDVQSSERFQEIADIAEHVVSEFNRMRCILKLSSN